MSTPSTRPSGFAWLELVLVVTILSLLLQLFPSLLTGAWWAIDVRNWPRGMWLAANSAAIFVLLAVRFVPILYDDWRHQHIQRAAYRQKQQRQQATKAQREVIERVKESRKRRIF